MPISIVVPQLGESITEGTVSKWLKQAGDRVRKDEPLVEIQTDKINVELPSPAEGTLEAITVPEGTTVPVGTEIGVLVGTAADDAAAPAPAGAPAAAPPHPEVEGDSARQGNLSPAVRRLMREYNVAMPEIAAIRGTGLAGRVSRDDLLEYLKGRATPPAATPAGAPSPVPALAAPVPALAAPTAPAAVLPGLAPAGPFASSGPREELIPFNRVRRLIAENMVRAKHTAAHTHCFDETDMSAVIALRREWAAKLEAQGVHLTYMPFFIKAAVLALREFPWVNGEVRGEVMVVKRYYNIGIAVGRADKGLIVPNLKDCDRKGLVQLAGEVNDLAARARAERLRPDEIAGGTFSITNAGVYGALNSAPVINLPEVAILGVHKIAERPVARGGQVVVRPMMNVAIGFDHRVVDGELAVKFLRRVCELLERPELLWFYA
jgi:2-oxoglutarate dehydrogenase E2 component (dihydrolipoamide succinyltransferase)